jgi:Co/Zn/Cd efflux system component
MSAPTLRAANANHYHLQEGNDMGAPALSQSFNPNACSRWILPEDHAAWRIARPMRSVWICSRNDAIYNLLVIGAGLLVLWTGNGLPDLMVALVMAALGVSGGWQIIRQARRELDTSAAIREEQLL